MEKMNFDKFFNCVFPALIAPIRSYEFQRYFFASSVSRRKTSQRKKKPVDIDYKIKNPIKFYKEKSTIDTIIGDLYTPENCHARRLSLLFNRLVKFNYVEDKLVCRYVNRAITLSPGLNGKQISLILNSAVQSFKILYRYDYVSLNYIASNLQSESTTLPDFTQKTRNSHGSPPSNACDEFLLCCSQLLECFSRHIPSGLYKFIPQDLVLTLNGYAFFIEAENNRRITEDRYFPIKDSVDKKFIESDVKKNDLKKKKKNMPGEKKKFDDGNDIAVISKYDRNNISEIEKNNLNPEDRVQKFLDKKISLQKYKRLFKKICEEIPHRLPYFETQHISCLANAIYRLQIKDDLLIEELAEEALKRVCEFDSRSITTLLHSFSRLKYYNSNFWHSMIENIYSIEVEFDILEFVLIANSYSYIGHYDETLFKDFLNKQFLQNIDEVQPSLIGLILTSYARFNVFPGKLISALCRKLTALLSCDSNCTNDLAIDSQRSVRKSSYLLPIDPKNNVASIFRKKSNQDSSEAYSSDRINDKILDEFSDNSMNTTGDMVKKASKSELNLNTLHLTQIVGAFGKLKYTDTKLMNLLKDTIVKRISDNDDISPLTLLNMANYFSHHTIRDTEMFSIIAKYSIKKIDEFHPDTLCALIYFFFKLNLNSQLLFYFVSEELSNKICLLNNQSLILLLTVYLLSDTQNFPFINLALAGVELKYLNMTKNELIRIRNILMKFIKTHFDSFDCTESDCEVATNRKSKRNKNGIEECKRLVLNLSKIIGIRLNEMDQDNNNEILIDGRALSSDDCDKSPKRFKYLEKIGYGESESGDVLCLPNQIDENCEFHQYLNESQSPNGKNVRNDLSMNVSEKQSTDVLNRTENTLDDFDVSREKHHLNIDENFEIMIDKKSQDYEQDHLNLLDILLDNVNTKKLENSVISEDSEMMKLRKSEDILITDNESSINFLDKSLASGSDENNDLLKLVDTFENQYKCGSYDSKRKKSLKFRKNNHIDDYKYCLDDDNNKINRFSELNSQKLVHLRDKWNQVKASNKKSLIRVNVKENNIENEGNFSNNYVESNQIDVQKRDQNKTYLMQDNSEMKHQNDKDLIFFNDYEEDFKKLDRKSQISKRLRLLRLRIQMRRRKY